MLTQTCLALAVAAYDFLFLFNVYDHHVAKGDLPGHKELYNPIYGIEGYRIVMPVDRMLVWTHVLLAAYPLIASVWQVSDAARNRIGNLNLHRWNGRVTLLCGMLSSYPAFKLALTVQDNGDYEHAVVGAFAVLWLLSALLTGYFAKAHNIAQHRAWGMRFMIYTHVIPVVTRVLGLAIWLYLGQPHWSIEKGVPKSSHPLLFPLVTWGTVAVLPLSEVFVAWEPKSTLAAQKQRRAKGE